MVYRKHKGKCWRDGDDPPPLETFVDDCSGLFNHSAEELTRLDQLFGFP
jgi:hypothetical protein